MGVMWWRRWVRQQALVNLTDGSAVDGVLYRAHSRHGVELRNATVHEPGREPTAANGAVLIPAERVAFIQIVGA